MNSIFALFLHIKFVIFMNMLNLSDKEKSQLKFGKSPINLNYLVMNFINSLFWIVTFHLSTIPFTLLNTNNFFFKGLISIFTTIEIKENVFSWILVTIFPINSILNPSLAVINLIKKIKKRNLLESVQKRLKNKI